MLARYLRRVPVRYAQFDPRAVNPMRAWAQYLMALHPLSRLPHLGHQLGAVPAEFADPADRALRSGLARVQAGDVHGIPGLVQNPLARAYVGAGGQGWLMNEMPNVTRILDALKDPSHPYHQMFTDDLFHDAGDAPARDVLDAVPRGLVGHLRHVLEGRDYRRVYPEAVRAAATGRHDVLSGLYDHLFGLLAPHGEDVVNQARGPVGRALRVNVMGRADAANDVLEHRKDNEHHPFVGGAPPEFWL